MLAVRGGVLAFEGRGTVLEEQLLPEVEERGRELLLVAQVRDGNTVNQVTPQDCDLLSGRVVLARLAQGRVSCRVEV